MCLWVAAFAVGDDDLQVEGESREVEEAEITASDRDHWSFRSLVRHDVPEAGRGWSANPIDRFVFSRMAERRLSPSPRASRSTLLRRVSYGLVGLPASSDELAGFLGDADPSAYERLVDRLLASYGYGERWAQHWLDLARFAETDGFEHDKIRTHAWKYRDWVIRALNQNLPVDQFIRWQIAGDLLVPDDVDAATATAFCLSGPDMPDINSQDERRHTLLNEITSTVGAVIMGLQVGCAQCHDHMFDPISQADFYRLRAFFDPAVVVEPNRSVTVLQGGEHASESRLMVRGDWRRPGPRIEPGFLRVICESDL